MAKEPSEKKTEKKFNEYLKKAKKISVYLKSNNKRDSNLRNKS